MSIPPQELVLSTITPLREGIIKVVMGAWSDWRGSPHYGIWRCKRSRANFVWEQIIHRAHEWLSPNEHVHILEGQETFRFLVDDRVLFRFKKTDEAGVTSNIPTQLALAYHDHAQGLFGLPEVHRVDVGYRLNTLETDIVDVLVIARDGSKVVWTSSLLEHGQRVVPLPIQVSKQETVPTRANQLVRPREDRGSRNRESRD